MPAIDSQHDLRFDRYGDISFFGNDISIISERSDIIYQNVVDRLISNFGDNKFLRYYGANISSFIGKNASRIEADVIASVIRSLTHDGYMPTSMFTVLTLLDNDKIYIRIDINNTGRNIPDSIKINAVFNTSSGMLHVTN